MLLHYGKLKLIYGNMGMKQLQMMRAVKIMYSRLHYECLKVMEYYNCRRILTDRKNSFQGANKKLEESRSHYIYPTLSRFNGQYKIPFQDLSKLF